MGGVTEVWIFQEKSARRGEGRERFLDRDSIGICHACRLCKVGLTHRHLCGLAAVVETRPRLASRYQSTSSATLYPFPVSDGHEDNKRNSQNKE